MKQKTRVVYVEKNRKTSAAAGCFAIISIIAGIFFAWSLYQSETSGDPRDSITYTGVRNDPLDGSVSHVVKYLRRNLKDPKSYEGVEWTELYRNPNGWWQTTHTYRAKNSFGGFVVETNTFYISPHGDTVYTSAEYRTTIASREVIEPVLSDPEPRQWTHAETGETVTATLLEWTSETATIYWEENTKTVPVSGLTDEDQAYLKTYPQLKKEL